MEELSALDKLKKILQEQPNTYTQIELSKKLGVSRERVRQLVNETKLRPLLRVREPYKHPCPGCGKVINRAIKLCKECHYAVHNMTLTCAECGGRFDLKTSDYKARLRRRRTSVGFFCTKRCYGLYVGRTFGWKPGHRCNYPESSRYGGVCAFCGTPFSNMRELLRHRNITRELSDSANRQKLINYRRKHSLWQTLAHFRVNQDTLRAIMKGLPTVRHSQPSTLEGKIKIGKGISLAYRLGFRPMKFMGKVMGR